jgi:hypothetical protein
LVKETGAASSSNVSRETFPAASVIVSGRRRLSWLKETRLLFGSVIDASRSRLL